MATGLAARIAMKTLLFVLTVAFVATAVAASVSRETTRRVPPSGCEGHGAAIALFESVPNRARGTSVRCADGTVDVLEGAEAEAAKRDL